MVERVIDGLSRFLSTVATIGTGLVLLIVSANIVGRYIFNRPLFWAEEVTATIIVLITLWPAAMLWREGRHIKLDLLAGKEGSLYHIIKEALVSLSAAVFSGILSWQAFKATAMVYAQGMREPSLLGTPLWIPYSIMVVGSAMILLVSLFSLYKNLLKLAR